MSWPLVNLGEVAEVDWGNTSITKASYVENGFPAFSATGQDGFLSFAEKNVDGIVLSAIGARCGKCFLAKERWTAIKNTITIIPYPSKADLSYLYALLNDEKSWQSKGAAQPFITLGIARNRKIPLPPLTEQKRIAEILDKAAAIKAKREQAIAKLDELAQSTFIKMFGNPATNSKKLPTIKLKNIGSWHSGGTPSRTNKKYFEGDVPWFSSGELNSMYVYESIEHISQNALENTSAKPVKKGSLMLGMYDTAALKASIAGKNCSCNQAIAFAEIDNSVVTTMYVYNAIVIGREHFRRLQRGVRQKNLNLDLIKNIEIPRPSLEAQKQFNEIAHQIQLAKNEHLKSSKRIAELILSLQNQAFTSGFSA